MTPSMWFILGAMSGVSFTSLVAGIHLWTSRKPKQPEPVADETEYFLTPEEFQLIMAQITEGPEDGQRLH